MRTFDVALQRAASLIDRLKAGGSKFCLVGTLEVVDIRAHLLDVPVLALVQNCHLVNFQRASTFMGPCLRSHLILQGAIAWCHRRALLSRVLRQRPTMAEQ